MAQKMKIKQVSRGYGSATLVQNENASLLVAKCRYGLGTNGADYQNAYSAVELTTDRAADLLDKYGKPLTCQEGDYLVYPFKVLWD